MSKVPPDLLHKIKSSVNLVEVVGEHVVLRKSGANFVGLCPFHSERTPSFVVSESKQLYHCYGCKRGGDLITFVMETFGLSFPEALEELAERAHIVLPKKSLEADTMTDPDLELEKKKKEARTKKTLAYKLNRFAAQFYHNQLLSHPRALQYFRGRGVDSELIRSFYAGFAPPQWDKLFQFLKEKKAPLPLALELGLIRPSPKHKQKGDGFDLFRNRALFPILDLRGKVAGFGGRTLPQTPEAPFALDSETETGPKYLNSPESILYQKDRLAFGLFQAQKHIREKDELILVEGYFDVLALHAAGFTNTVATCGTALSHAHLHLLRRFCSRMIVLFDGDEAGRDATQRAMETALEEGIVLYGTTLPQNCDPDEILIDSKNGNFTADGKEKLSALIGDARPLLDEKIEFEIANALGDSEAKTQALKRIATWLSRFKDPIGKEIRTQNILKKLGISRSLLQKASLEKADFFQKNKLIVNTTEKQTPVPPMTLSTREIILFTAFIWKTKYLKILQEVQKKLPPDTSIKDLFESKAAKDFFMQIHEKYSKTLENYDLIALFPETPARGESLLEFAHHSDVIRSTLTAAVLAQVPPYADEEVQLALNRSIGRLWARFSQRIKQAMAQAEAKRESELQSKLMKDYLDVQRKMKEFNKFYDEA